MQLWQYRQWASDLQPPVRAHVDALIDALETLLPIADRAVVLHGAGAAVLRLWNAMPPRVWVVTATERPPALVLGVCGTEPGAAEVAEIWRIEALSGKLGPGLVEATIDLKAGVWGTHTVSRPRELTVSWDEYPVRVP
jgi:hypothetical protein